MSTLVATVENEHEAEEVVRQLVSAGMRPKNIAVVGAQGVPLSLEAEQATAMHQTVRGMIIYAIVGALIGLLCGLLTLSIPGLGPMALLTNSYVSPAFSIPVLVVAGTGFGAMVGFLANAVAGEEKTAPFMERLRPGQLAVVVDEHRANPNARSILARFTQAHPTQQISG